MKLLPNVESLRTTERVLVTEEQDRAWRSRVFFCRGVDRAGGSWRWFEFEVYDIMNDVELPVDVSLLERLS